MEGLALENENRVEYNRYFGEFDIIKINTKEFPPYLNDLPTSKDRRPNEYSYSEKTYSPYKIHPGLCSEKHPLVSKSLSTEEIQDSEALAILDSPSGQRVVLMVAPKTNWQISNELILPSNKGLGVYEVINKKWDKNFALPFEMRDNEDIASILINYDGTLIRYMSERIRNSWEHISLALSKCPCSLRDMPYGIRDNYAVVTYATNVSPIAIKYASANIKNDKSYIKSLAKKNPEIRRYSKMLFTSRDGYLSRKRHY